MKVSAECTSVCKAYINAAGIKVSVVTVLGVVDIQKKL